MRTTTINNVSYPANRVPVALLESFRAEHPGVGVRYRGKRVTVTKGHTRKADATHFYVNRFQLTNATKTV